MSVATVAAPANITCIARICRGRPAADVVILYSCAALLFAGWAIVIDRV
ncbi:hypothetical protein [Mycobacterium montefiorense]|nr:hypothetical protein [Mycobacterium montefiorense]MCV7429783.1 hypothetical protein [Mycobacterium montefiorense]